MDQSNPDISSSDFLETMERYYVEVETYGENRTVKFPGHAGLVRIVRINSSAFEVWSGDQKITLMRGI